MSEKKTSKSIKDEIVQADETERPIDESDEKIAEFLAKSKRRKLGQVPRAALSDENLKNEKVQEETTLDPKPETEIDQNPEAAIDQINAQAPSFELKADPAQSLAGRTNPSTNHGRKQNRFTAETRVEPGFTSPNLPVENYDQPVQELEAEVAAEDLMPLEPRQPLYTQPDHETPQFEQVEFDRTEYDLTENEQANQVDAEQVREELHDPQPSLSVDASSYALPPLLSGPETQSETQPKSKRHSKPSPKRKKKRGFWSFLKASYRTLGIIVFLGALCLVMINFSKPWLQAWLKDERPAITLPSVSNLRAMPLVERLRLKNSAIRLAPFKERRLASDPIPFEGGRPTELDQFRIRAVGENVDLAGLLRLYEMPDKRQFLRLTDFEITAGYDLRVLLSAHANPKTKEDLDSQGYVDLAALKGENGPQNYLLPKTFELSDFGSFVIYDQLFEIVYAVSRL